MTGRTKRWGTAVLSVLAFGVVGAGQPAPSLSAYLGKYPSNKVAGVSLYDHPTFRRLVIAAAPNMTVRGAVLSSGVETPMERQGALLVVQMCEPHNCIGHQWTVAIMSPSGPAAICYHDSDLMDDEGRWFIGGVSIGRTRRCWQGDHTDVPDAVFTALAKGS